MVTMVRRLALKEHSDALVQLASPITAAMMFSVGFGEVSFAKVKVLITDLISRLRQRPPHVYCVYELVNASLGDAVFEA